MVRMTGEVGYRTGKGHEPGKGARILVTAHPDEQEGLLDRVVGLLQAQQDCIVYYFDVRQGEATEEAAPDLTQERIAEVVSDMQLVVALVTQKMLLQPNPAMDAIVPYALEHNVAVLPLLVEDDRAQAYARRFGDLQYLVPDDPDPTALPFDQKLAAYLSEVLVSDELAQRVRDAFDALVFLSYRKTNRAYAAELMRMIHRNPRYRDIAFWYDEFLVPGEDFNEGIGRALAESDLFALVVTPQILERPNYVMDCEYPAARDARKPILPVAMSRLTDEEGRELKRLYRRIPACVDATDGALPDSLSLRRLRRLATGTGMRDPQHTFLIGLAYLDGINMEVDQQRAVALITEAAEAGLVEAMRRLAALYKTGKGVRRSLDTSIDWLVRARDASWDRYAADKSDENLQALIQDIVTLGNRLHQARRVRDLYACLYDQRQRELEALERGLEGARHDLAVCLCKFAEVCAMVGQTWEGVGYCWEAVAHFEELLVREPSDPARRDAYIACRTLAQIYAQRREWADAVGMYRLARERLRAVETDEYRDSLVRDHAALWRVEGDALMSLRQADEAAACYERAREVSETAYAKRADTVSRRSLINTYDKLVRHYRGTDRRTEARAYLRRELELVEEELEEATDAGLRVNGLLYELGGLHEELGEGDEAIRRYRAALETPEEDPDGTQSRETKVGALRALTRLSHEVGLEGRSEEFFWRMCDLLRELYDATLAPEYLEALGDELEGRAGYDDRTTDVRLLEEAFDVRRQLEEAYHSLDHKARCELLRERLDRIYRDRPETFRPWAVVCDPNDDERAALVEQLGRMGLHVAFASSQTTDFYRQYEETRAHLLLLGLRRRVTGELADLRFLLRSLDPNAKVILVADQGMGDVMDEGLRIGACGALVRPLSHEQLEKQVRAALQGWGT